MTTVGGDIAGTVDVSLTPQGAGEPAYVVSLYVVVPAGGTAYASSFTVRTADRQPISRDRLAQIAAQLDVFTDGGAAYLAEQQAYVDASKAASAGTAIFTAADGTQIEAQAVLGPHVPEDYAQQAHEELRRRRRGRLTDSDYERVAQVYRAAIAEGRPTQHAVKDAFTVSQSRAAALIGEARKRGLLPPTTRGKAKA